MTKIVTSYRVRLLVALKRAGCVGGGPDKGRFSSADVQSDVVLSFFFSHAPNRFLHWSTSSISWYACPRVNEALLQVAIVSRRRLSCTRVPALIPNFGCQRV